jgi:hypothetical protein
MAACVNRICTCGHAFKRNAEHPFFRMVRAKPRKTGRPVINRAEYIGIKTKGQGINRKKSRVLLGLKNGGN